MYSRGKVKNSTRISQSFKPTSPQLSPSGTTRSNKSESNIPMRDSASVLRLTHSSKGLMLDLIMLVEFKPLKLDLKKLLKFQFKMQEPNNLSTC